MNSTANNIAPDGVRLSLPGWPVRNILLSIVSVLLISFFGSGYAQHISNGRSAYEKQNAKSVSANAGKSVVSKTAAAIISTGAGGLWSAGATWVGGVPPTAADDVTIVPGATVIVDVSTAVCRDITIDGTLIFNAGFNLEVNGNWANNGALTASTGTVTFKGAAGNTISGSAASAFNNIIVDKGTNPTSVLDATGTGALSNTGTLTITNGLFKMTTGTFQFGGGSGIIIPETGGIWVAGATFNSGLYSITNNGWIRISAGTANFGTGSGNAVHTQNKGFFEVSGGIVNISGRLENTASTPSLTGIPGNGFSMTAGTIILSTQGNNLSNKGSFDMSSSSILNITGGTIILETLSTAASPIDINIISGTGSKTITGGNFQIGNASSGSGSTFLISSPVPFYNLTVYSNSIKASLQSNDLTITNQLTLNGHLLLNNQDLILGASAPAIAGTLSAANGMIIANNGASGGEVRKLFSGNGSYVFPIGENTGTTEYSPVTVNFTSGTYAAGAYAAVKVINSKHPNNANTTNYLNRYWNISTSGITNPGYDVIATYVDADISGTEPNIGMGKYTSSLPWIKYGAANAGTNSVTATGITNTGTISFSGITLAPPTVNITPASPTICAGSPTTLTANATGDPILTYLWSPGGETTSSITVSPTSTTSYSVTVTDGNGFPATANATVTVNPAPTVFTVTGGGSYCAGGNGRTVGLNNSQTGVNYQLQVDGANTGAPVAGTGSAISFGLNIIAGTYTVIATTTSTPACAGAMSGSVSVSINPLPTVSFSKTDVLCFGNSTGAINITPAGGTQPYAYAWTGTGVNVTSEDQTGLAAGNFSVIVTDFNGCSSSALPVTITQPVAAVTVALTSQTNVLCFGASTGAINITASGGTGTYTYAWTGTGVNATAEDQTGLAAGNYSVIVTDANGCTTSSLAVTITQPVAAVTVALTSQTNVLCFGASTGAINITASGGTGAYTYAWTGTGVNATAEDQTGLAAGNYSVIVTDANGCTTSSLAVTITQPAAAVTVALTSQTNVLCFGASTGAINITASGGTGTYTYAWTGTGVNATAEDQTGLAAGNYSVIVTDANGCTTSSLAVTITQPVAAVTVALTSQTNVLCFGASTGAINITASGGTGAYTYAWTGTGVNATAEDQTGLAAGNYSVIVTDANGCTTSSLAVTITQPVAAVTVALTSQTNVLCFGASTGAINITASGGTGTYTYAWTGTGVNATAEDQTGLAAGNYSVIVTDANGCTTSSLAVTITQPVAAVTVALTSQTNVLCFGASTGAINITASGGTGAYTYAWTGTGVNATAEDQTGLAAGNYSVIVTDANGCTTSSLAVTITQPVAALTITNISSNTPVCSGNPLNLTTTVTGGTGTLSYNWSGPNSFTSAQEDPSVAAATTAADGVYTLQVTDANNCTASATTTVVITTTPVITNQTPAAICSGSSVTLNAAIFTGTNTIPGGTTYTWSAPSATGLTGLTSGTDQSSFTTGTLTNSTNAAINATYTVTPKSGSCTGTPFTITVSVNPVPSVTNQTPAAICSGNSVTLDAATFTGANTIPTGTTYTWTAPSAAGITGLSSGTDQSSFTTGTLTNTTTATINITYTVTPKSGACTGNPFTVTVTVNVPPAITTHPSVNTICANNTAAIFSANATSYTNPTIQWQVSVDNGATWGPATGTVSNTYSSGTAGTSLQFTPGNPDNGTLYRAVFTNPCGTTASNSAILNVGSGVNFPKDLESKFGCAAGSTFLTTKITGGVGLSGTLTYFWERSVDGITWELIPGTTETHPASGNYDPAYAPKANEINYYFRLGVSNNGCLTYTTAARVTINPTAVVNQPGNVVVCNPAAVNVNFTGTNVTTYNWSNDNTAIGLAATGTGNISFTAVNATTNPITATITITPINSGNGLDCPGEAKTFTITVNPSVTVNAGSDQTLCQSGTAITLSGASVTGGTTTGTWSVSPAGSGTLSNTGSTTSPATITFTPASGFSGVATLTLTSSDPDGTGPCQAVTDARSITVNAVSAGTIGANQTICSSGNPAAFTTVTAAIGTGTLTYQWQSNTTGCNGTWADITGANSATYDPPTGVTVTTYYRRVVTSTINGVACTDNSNCITVTVNSVTAGAIATDQQLCYGGTVGLLTDETPASGAGTLSYQWQRSTDNGTTWTNISGANGATYSPGTITQNTLYRRVVTSTLNGIPCTAISGDVEILLNPVNPGSISADQTICSGADPVPFTSVAASFTGNNIDIYYKWQSAPTATGPWTDITALTLAPTNATYDPPSLTDTTYYRRVTIGERIQGKPSRRFKCEMYSNVITVTVNPPPTVTVNSHTVCSSALPVTITATPGTGNANTYDYAWTTVPAGATNPGNNNTFSATIAGDYTVIITNKGSPKCSSLSATGTLTINPQVTPTFTAVAPICSGGTLSALPTTSNNGIPGTWSPALNNTATTTYTFTPAAGQCATTATLQIVVNPVVTPTFTAVGPICSGAALSPLPTTSNNGITGTWSPALNNTATTTYTFTPTAGQCATTTTLQIVVNPNVTPTFTAVAPICSGATLSALPTTSNNGITGTWSPALNNTATTTYTFTPTAGQCATTAQLTIIVNQPPVITGNLTVCVGLTTQLTGSPTGGSWVSSNPSVATVSSNGLVTGVVQGTATITYTDSNGCTQTATITVTPKPTTTIYHN